MLTHSDADYDTLVLLFRRASSLPELPGSALRLIHAIDTGSASAKDLEHIISADPGLSANVLRISNVRVPGDALSGISTIRAAIMRLGQRSVRTLAVSLMLQEVTHGRGVANDFSIDRFARHSLFVAFLSKYLFARRNLSNNFESEWAADEMFAAALLHDLGLALLARVSPESYFRVHSFALRTENSLDMAFQRIYGTPINQLAKTAVEAWTLPEIFSLMLTHINEPWTYPKEYTPLCCLNQANHLAYKAEVTSETWPCRLPSIPEVEEEVPLSQQEQATVIEHVNQQVEAYLTDQSEAA